MFSSGDTFSVIISSGMEVHPKVVRLKSSRAARTGHKGVLGNDEVMKRLCAAAAGCA